MSLDVAKAGLRLLDRQHDEAWIGGPGLGRWGGFAVWNLGDTEDETAFFRWKLRRQIESAGFKSVEVRPFDFLHPLVPAALVAQTDRLGRLMERIPMLREIAGSLLITASR